MFPNRINGNREFDEEMVQEIRRRARDALLTQ
jgi:hypothetical protein